MIILDFQLKVLILSFSITVMASIILIPILKRLKVGQNEREDGPQSHISKQGTPTMGGIIIMISVVLTAIAGFVFYYLKNDIQVAFKILPMVFIALGFGTVGLVDDAKKVIFKNTKGLKPAYKMIGLLVVSVIFVVYITQVLKIGTSTYIPFVKTYINLPILVYIPFAIFVILATTNAVNLTDGVDGLATSVSAIIMTFFTVLAMMLDVKEITIFGAIVVGACLGFLVFNLHTAKVMMGDTGSLMLGGIIASVALYLKNPLILIVVALIPIIETISVMLQVMFYKKTGKRIFKMAPIHHHFELSGWKENKVVSIFSLVTFSLCVVALYAI